jgi:hypothetical protein
VACSRCERAGQYKLDTLIARHGKASAFRSCCVYCPKIAQSAHRLALMTCAAFIARNCPGSSSARRTDPANLADLIALRRSGSEGRQHRGKGRKRTASWNFGLAEVRQEGGARRVTPPAESPPRHALKNIEPGFSAEAPVISKIIWRRILKINWRNRCPDRPRFAPVLTIHAIARWSRLLAGVFLIHEPQQGLLRGCSGAAG